MRQGGFMKNNVLTAGLIFSLFTTVSAKAADMDSHLDFNKVTTVLKSVEENIVPTDEIANINLDEQNFSMPMLMQEGVDPMAIVDIFLKLWQIVKDGAPVVNAQYKNVTALPNLAENNWTALTGWKKERVLTFSVYTENLYGIKTVDLEYQVKLLSGGGVKGRGQYIASARVVPTKVEVLWGYNLDVTVEVPSVLNLSTTEDPLAAINLDVNYRISTILKSSSESNSYQLRGDGMMISNGKVLYEARSR